MKKLKIIQYYTSNIEYAKTAEIINKEYCEKYSIDYFVETSDELIRGNIDNRHITWYKIKMLLDQLKTNEYEYIMYIDADAIFTNFDHSILDIIEKNNTEDLIITTDNGGDLINTGVMIFKNTEWSIDFLERVWDKAEYIARGVYKTAIWHEQTIISAFLMLNPDDKLHSKILEWDQKNSINDFVYRPDNTFIYHDLSKIRIKELYNVLFDTITLETELNLTTTSDRQLLHKYGSFYLKKIDELLKIQNTVNILDIGGDDGVLFNIILKYYPQVHYENLTTRDYEFTSNIKRIKYNTLDNDTLDDFLLHISPDEIKYDIIISDYEHRCEVRDFLFSKLFNKVNSGGMYVIEDLQTDREIAIPEKNQQWNWGDPNKKSMTQLINQFNVDGTFDSDYVDFGNLNKLISSAEVVHTTGESCLGVIYKR